MVEAEEVRKRIDRLIVKGQDEVLDASRKLSREITREAKRVVPPLSTDMTHLVDEIFDFTERVLNGQRKMVRDVLRSIEDAAPKGPLTHRRHTGTAKKTSAKTAPAKKTPAKKAAAKSTEKATTKASASPRSTTPPNAG